MMRKPLLIANWKMYGTCASTHALLTTLKSKMLSCNIGIGIHSPTIIILPPAIFLSQVAQLLESTLIKWGAQNMASAQEGAYTGELSGAMLKEFGCQYVLLGHSERRQYYGETDRELVKKFKLAKQLELTPILCVGETQEQYEASQTQKVIQEQLDAILDLGDSILENSVLAYEPVWAIGTGLSASPEQAQAVHAALRQYISRRQTSLLAQRLRILYGGSVNPGNAQALFAMPDIDGGLVGGASLDAEAFLKIYQMF